MNKKTVAEAFGAASARYDAHAGLQRLVAGRLAMRIPATAGPSVLEIGCGTGFLAAALRPRLRPASWFLTDLSEGMVGHCRETMETPPDTHFLVMDGELPALARGRFDLVCSSLVFQWFSDPAASLPALAALLAPGGELHFATLGADSFAEWREAHREAGVLPGIPEYPGPKALTAMLPGLELEEERIRRDYASGLDFLAELKAIGAQRTPLDRPPLPAGTLRRLLRRFEPPAGLGVTYQIIYGRLRA